VATARTALATQANIWPIVYSVPDAVRWGWSHGACRDPKNRSPAIVLSHHRRRLDWLRVRL